MLGILERWNDNQVTPSLSKPHELSYRSNIREKIKTKGERRNTRMNKDKIELTFQPGDLVLLRACNVASAAAGKVAKFLPLYEEPYKVKKRIARNTYILSSTETERERRQFHAVEKGDGVSDDSPEKASKKEKEKH